MALSPAVWSHDVNLKDSIHLPLLSPCLPTDSKLSILGATASVKGSAYCASFSSGKFALRALSQSLAREFGPQGVHISHVIIDGVIDVDRTKHYAISAPDGKIDTGSVSLQPFPMSTLHR